MKVTVAALSVLTMLMLSCGRSTLDDEQGQDDVATGGSGGSGGGGGAAPLSWCDLPCTDRIVLRFTSPLPEHFTVVVQSDYGHRNPDLSCDYKHPNVVGDPTIAGYCDRVGAYFAGLFSLADVYVYDEGRLIASGEWGGIADRTDVNDCGCKFSTLTCPVPLTPTDPCYLERHYGDLFYCEDAQVCSICDIQGENCGSCEGVGCRCKCTKTADCPPP
jgi:hypothetical protein